MGFFSGDDDESPPITYTPYQPIDATKTNPPINFMRIFDNISGQEFVFNKGKNGERYLKLQNEIQAKKDEYNREITPRGPWDIIYSSRAEQLSREISALEKESDTLITSAGDTEVTIRDLSGKIPIDAPFETVFPDFGNLKNVDLNLPEVRKLIPFEMRYAAAVADVTNRLRELGKTITGLEITDPMALERHAPFIKAFKDANKLSLERGFDIQYNGIDNKLREMGLNNSTTALGALITLQNQKVDKEIENNFKEYAFANQLKQESINNLVKTGSVLAQEGDLSYRQYAQDSANQLQIRNQDLAASELEQRRAQAIQAAQLQMNQQQLAQDALRLDKAKAERSGELAQRELMLQQQLARNPVGMGLNFIANNNTNAVNAVGVTNAGMFNRMQGELKASELEQERFRMNQLANRNNNLFGNILSNSVNSVTGELVKTGTKKLTDKLFG